MAIFILILQLLMADEEKLKLLCPYKNITNYLIKKKIKQILIPPSK